LISLARHHRCFKECLSGLSPDALCRIQALNLNNKKFQTWSLIFILTQSKLCC
jgi:hypothetical protein